MSTWMSEQEFRQSDAESAGVTINVAFLHEIKTDFGFRDLLNRVYHQLKPNAESPPLGSIDEPAILVAERASPRQAADLLSDLRDELETYFALEEFYGYFSQSAIQNPSVSQKAIGLQSEHEKLFIKLNEIVELAEKIVYHEIGPDTTIEDVAEELEEFCIQLAAHEQAEMDLMMRLCNEDFGVGD